MKPTRAGSTAVIFLVVEVCCHDKYLHCTDPKLVGERVNITFRWIRNHLSRCPLGAGIVCCLAICARGSSVSSSEGMDWSALGFWVHLLVLYVFFCICGPRCCRTLTAGTCCILGETLFWCNSETALFSLSHGRFFQEPDPFGAVGGWEEGRGGEERRATGRQNVRPHFPPPLP